MIAQPNQDTLLKYNLIQQIFIESLYVKSTKDNTKMNRTLFVFSRAYKLKDTYIGLAG